MHFECEYPDIIKQKGGADEDKYSTKEDQDMKRKLFDGLLCTAMLCLIMCTATVAEDVPMTEEEIFYSEEDFSFEEDYSVETEAEEERILAEEEGILDADGLVEEEEVLEAASDGDVTINAATFPDASFRAFLRRTYADGGDVIPGSTISGITDMYAYSEGINDLTGIKVFNNLQKLECYNNAIKKLDLSGLTSLTELRCYGGPMTSLNVSGCTALDMLDCSESELTNLNVNGCRNLRYMYCYANQLTSLDLHTCTNLTWLECDGNQMTSLDVSFCKSLKEVCESVEPVIESNTWKYETPDNEKHLWVDPGVKVITVHTHTWDSGKVTREATTTSTGIKTYTCTLCGETKMDTIPKLTPVVPTEKITITKKPTIQKPTATKSKITVKWKHFKHTSKKAQKIWKSIKKVQIQCATDKTFKNIVKTTTAKKSKTSAKITGLKKNTTYYVRVRYYDGIGYSAWSKTKKVKTKK